MKLMFVLILWAGFPGSYGGEHYVRVGAYYSWHQCSLQAQQFQDRESGAFCIPVNVP